MLKTRAIDLISGLIFMVVPLSMFSQDRQTGVNMIDAEDLEIHVSFLASPFLKGRANGQPELETALNYIASQAQRINLRPANGSDYFQQYCLKRSFNSMDIPQYSILSCDDTQDTAFVGSNKMVMHNVVAWIEGSDPVLKSEYVVFSCHADHIGTRNGIICSGADDNASGCSALIEIAEAFQKSVKKPLRSILFLWFTGEEIGLFGSQAYVNNPSFPLENTIVDLNLDMIGRIKGIADTTSETPVSGPLSVFIIADEQSKELMKITREQDERTPLDFDYSLSGRDSYLNLFARSDHYNFVKKDIPVLFFTSGLHSDYHTPGDIAAKLDYEKMELVTKSVFEIGWEIANKRQRLVVDNPFSKWQ
jgi:hypothetical protein